MAGVIDMCDGAACIAKRDCLRWCGTEYWVPTKSFEPGNAYQCAGFLSHIPQNPPKWVQRIYGVRA